MNQVQLMQSILSAVGDHQDATGTSPTVREIMAHTGLTSMGKAIDVLTEMVKADLLIRPTAGKHRGYRLSEKGREVYERTRAVVCRDVMRFHVGRVRAGAMVHEWQEILDHQASGLYFDPDDLDVLEVSMGLLPNRGEGVFALRVAGDSMVDAMINDGDIVLVQRFQGDAPPRNGTMVVARDRADGESVTLKHYHDAGDEIELRPANCDYSPIRLAKRHVDILGTVLVVVRSWPKQLAPVRAA